MYYDDVVYASKRLKNTLVRLSDGRPFFVLEVTKDEDEVIWCVGEVMAPTNERQTVLLSALDLEPVPLGFVNTSEGMVYTCRKPMRRDWKQGLSHNSLVAYGHIRAEDMPLKLLCQPILATYPSFDQALGMLRKGKPSSAFSREFGVSKVGEEIHLIYRRYKVGEWVDDRITLDTTKFFLEQHLAESMENRA